MITKFKLYEENSEYKLDISELTLNQWGGFEMGDGEYFITEKELFSSDNEPDFYIKTIKEDNILKTYFIPSKTSYQKYLDGKIDEFYKNQFYYVGEYVASKKDIIDYAIKIEKDRSNDFYYEINNNIVEIDDQLWFYANFVESGKLTLLETETHPLYKETQALRDKYAYARNAKKFKI